MQVDRWQNVQDLYFRALEMPEVHRTPFLETACQHDPEMRQEIESLLEREDALGDFLEPVTMEALAEMVGSESTAGGADDTDDIIGAVIDDRYVVTQHVGSGGMGDVYRADHRLLGTPVAIKRLSRRFRDQKEHRQRSLEEARRAIVLDHENIARVKDVVEESNEVFVVMEFVDGQTLTIYRDHPPSLEQFLNIATQCASGLAAAHEQRIAHLDIKPANVMVTTSGRVKICDFGVARRLPSAENGVVDREETRWTFGGTPSYMAPEVLEGNQFDVRADVFSLGIVFYEVLSGSHPFLSEDVQTTTKRILNEPSPTVRGTGKKLPLRLTRLVERMLSKDPRGRLTAAQTLHELQVIQRRQKILKDARRAPRELIPLIRRKPAAALSIVIAVFLVTSGAIYFRPLSLLGFAPLPDKKLVAVLPFRVTGDRSDKLFYAQGVSEMLALRLMELTAVPDLRIEPPSSVREGNIHSVEAARAELGATLVVDGSFKFSGNEVMFEYSLIRTSDNEPLRWGTLKTSSPDDIPFSEDVIEEVSAQLEMQLAPVRGSGVSSRKAFSLYRDGLGALANYHEQESLDAAVKLLGQAVELDSKYAAAYAALGQAYWYKYQENQQRFPLDQSLAACQQASSLVPHSSDAQVCLGRVYQQKGDWQLAIEYYKRAIQYSAANDEAFRLLGSVYKKQKRFDEAERNYLWAIKLRGDWASYSWIAEFYDSRRQYAKARDNFQTAQSLSGGKNARVHYSIASAYVNLGQYGLAAQSLEESARLRPYAARPVSNLGLVYLMGRKYPDAVRELKRAFELEIPGDLDTNYRITGNLARIYHLTNQMPEAREKYELAIKQGKDKLQTGDDDRVHILLGRYYAMLGMKEEAKNHIRQALLSWPDDPHYLLIAATAHSALGERSNALSYMERAVHLGYTEVQITAEPELDALKYEPRYIALMSSLQQGR